MDTSPHKSDFVYVNGSRLHYLDWGGTGDVILFLAGLGCNAHIYDHFAPLFTDRFHAIALTRRGHGESDHPESGYDIDTLTEDIRQFLEVLRIDQAILVGHSMANVELSHFSALHPERVLKLVYLDAAYNRSNAAYREMLQKNPLRAFQPPGLNDDHYTPEAYNAAMQRAYPALAAVWGEVMDEHARHEIMQTPEGKVVDRMSDAIGAALNATLTSCSPEDSQIRVPTLSIYTVSNCPYYISDDWMTEEQKVQVREFFDTTQDAWVRGNIEQFRRDVPHARIVVIPAGHHYCFIKKEDQVYNEMRKFLLS